MTAPMLSTPAERVVPLPPVPLPQEPPPSTDFVAAESTAFVPNPAENTPRLLPVAQVEVQLGFNPRKFFNPVRYQKLVDSVRQHRRIFHNIVVRPQPDRPGWYWVVAGERRWRAANEVTLLHIPALVLDLTDEEALALAIAENQDRDDITPAEEALSAQRMMQLTQGDRQEAAKRLRWSMSTLESRLLLCQASEAVLMALAEGKIFLGHAELLSPLPEVTQNGTLQEIIARQISVEELRVKLAAFALDLATALFDKSGCQGCPHNTTRQASLFEQNIGEGRCTNRPCFHQKTVEHLQELRVGLRDEHNAVYFDTERAPDSWALLLKREVGSQQFNEGCKQCTHFGCLISSRLGEAGKLTKDVCFNLTCRSEKIAAFHATLNAPEPQDEAPSQVSAPSAASAKNQKNQTRKSSAGAAALPKRVLELIHGVHCRAAAVEVERNKKMVQVYAALALLEELKLVHTSSGAGDPLTKRGIKRGSSDTRTALIGPLYALESTELSALTVELAARISTRGSEETSHHGTLYLKGAQSTLRVLDVDLAQHFCLDAQFLEAHTKAGIESLLTEAGFVTYYNTQKNDKEAFKKLMSEKHAEIIRKVMKAGFDFTGFVPKALRVPAK